MRAIEVEDHIYEYLRQHQIDFSEPVSQVLERELKLRRSAAVTDDSKNPYDAQSLRAELLSDERDKALWDFIKSPAFQSERSVVGRFLQVLGFLHRQNRDKFAALQGMAGRSRKYFAKTESELRSSGTSVNPKRIPGSDYWVVTNNSTVAKCELVRDVLKVLGYRGGLAVWTSLRVGS